MHSQRSGSRRSQRSVKIASRHPFGFGDGEEITLCILSCPVRSRPKGKAGELWIGSRSVHSMKMYRASRARRNSPRGESTPSYIEDDHLTWGPIAKELLMVKSQGLT